MLINFETLKATHMLLRLLCAYRMCR